MNEDNVYQRLMKVQKAIVAPKSQYNSYGKYKYRSLEDITEAVKPLLAEHGLTLTVSDTIIEIGDRIYIKATATVVNIDKPDQKISAEALAREPASRKGMDEAQVTGSTSSYARKYCLNGLFAIDDCKDADAQPDPMHNTPKQQGQQPKPKQAETVGLTEDQKKWLSNYCAVAGISTNEQKADLMKRYRFNMQTDPIQFAMISKQMSSDLDRQAA